MMWKRLWALWRCDLRLNWRNGFVLVTVAVALVYAALLLGLVPEQANVKPMVYLLDETADQRYLRFALEQAASDAAKVTAVSDEAALQAALTDDRYGVGVALRDVPAPSALRHARLYFQAYHHQQVQKLAALALEEQLRQVYGLPSEGVVDVRTTYLRSADLPAVSFRDALAPLLLFSDPALIGLVFIGVLIFVAKDEGALRAYLVTPGRTWEYLLSKALGLATLAVLFALILAPLTLGLRPHYGHLLALMVASGLFSSLLGAWIAVRFDNLSQFLFPAVGMVLLLGLPGVSYFAPSFSPWWLRIIPTYSLIFGLREAAFPTGDPWIVWRGVLILLACSAAMLPLVSRAFDRHFARR